jgi:hypothetical protein
LNGSLKNMASPLSVSDTIPLSSANFVGIVVGFLNVFSYTPAEPPYSPPRYPLKSKWYNGR